jgi:hypothetical protein
MSVRPAPIVFVLALSLAAANIACRQILGLDDGPSCWSPSGTTSCAACAEANCCAESNACAADMTCSNYESCLGACDGGPACRSRCTIKFPVLADKAAPVSALSACLASKCEIACGLGCGGFAGYLSEPDASVACQECLENTNACSHAHACGSSAECDAFWRCILACQTQTPDCQWACVPEHGAGAALFRQLYQDFSGTCAGACGYGAYWACAGNVASWPHAPSDVDWTWLVDLNGGGGLPDASVSICTACPCDGPFNSVLADAGQTNSNGYVTIAFPPPSTPTSQGIPACTQTTADGYVTNFGYPGYPMTEGVVSIDNSLLPPSAWGILMYTPTVLSSRIAATGTMQDPALGVIGMGVYDCLGSPAGGVDVSINTPDATPWPAIDAGADALPTARTNGSGPFVGRAGFWNVPPGNAYILTATLPDSGTRVSQVHCSTAAGTFTQVGMPPTPSPTP